MNEFKDKQVIYARLYLFLTPLVLILSYIVILLTEKFYPGFNISGQYASEMINNITGSLLAGYAIACEMTVLYIFLQLFRKSKTGIRILLCVFLIPIMLIFIFPSFIAAIPYYIYTANKTKNITIDNLPLFSKRRIIILVLGLLLAVGITIFVILR